MTDPPPFEVVATRSGARAMLDRATREVMHPSGPVEEARGLYVRPSRLADRLQARQAGESEPLVLFDVGLGAGSNAAAAWTLSEEREAPARKLHIVSFDRTLAALELAASPEHRGAFGLAEATLAACAALLEGRTAEGASTQWRAHVGELPSTLRAAPAGSADVVFWDPFSPRANPELWNVSAFAALRRACRDGATVHTYSGATAIRTALLLAGFAVGLGNVLSPGRQATIAATRLEDLEAPLDARWLERVSRSSRPFSADAPSDALERIRTLVQFRR
jgi:queuine tRNA-ribosyltransferase